MRKTPSLLLVSVAFTLAAIAASHLHAEKKLTDYVNPFLGTTAPSGLDEVGFVPNWKVWGGLTFPGSSLPNAMVQLSPVTEFGSGAGYEYEHKTIIAFAHTNKGHWSYCDIPILPVTGKINPDDFGSRFSHKNESAVPGYYQVWLERYKINAELTSTLRCGFHRYTIKSGQPRLIVNLPVSNNRVKDWKISKAGNNAFEGYQEGREKVYFYATTSRPIKNIEMLEGRRQLPNPKTRQPRDQKHTVPVINFIDKADGGTLEIKIGLSFVSTENARRNLEAELAGKDFKTVRAEASEIWEKVLSKIKVSGGTEKQKGMFYSCLYRAFLWPALRSDVNGEFTNQSGRVVKKDFAYYTIPSLWDTYRNKLVLISMLSPKLTADVIQSMIDRGENTGYMPIFFHGDHAAPFISGAYLRGIRGFDVKSAYKLLLNNATDTSRKNTARPYLDEYIERGYVSTIQVPEPVQTTQSSAGVTKTLEYAYDDYSIALLAREFGDQRTYETMMQRSRNYANVFDPSTGLMRGRRADGGWVTPFDPERTHDHYMYREANAWQSSFFAPHDTPGLIKLYPDERAFENQLDRLFTIPWNQKFKARNINTFIGQYCHGNQPDHGFPYLYYWVGRQEKTQMLVNFIMDRFYGMRDGITLCGMDDTGEMTSWYVFNAIGLYTYSPGDDNYIVTVPMFEEIKLDLSGHEFTITKESPGVKIQSIKYDGKELMNGQQISGYFITHRQLMNGKHLSIKAALADAK